LPFESCKNSCPYPPWQGYWQEQIPIREAEDGIKYFLKTNKLDTWIIQSISYLKGAMMKWLMTWLDSNPQYFKMTFLDWSGLYRKHWQQSSNWI
jgi:hypothetical protein